MSNAVSVSPRRIAILDTALILDEQPRPREETASPLNRGCEYPEKCVFDNLYFTTNMVAQQNTI